MSQASRSLRPAQSKEMRGRAHQSAIEVIKVTTEYSEPPTIVIDAEQVFMLYASFCGDVQRTAYASGVTVGDVIKLATEGSWTAKLNGLIELKKTERAGDVERGISRAMNFIQAHRYRMFLERVLRKLVELKDDKLVSYLVAERLDKEGGVAHATLSTKPLADLATAMEKVHWMTYIALSDTVQDRARRKESQDNSEEIAECDIHARIAKALTEMRVRSPAGELADAQEDHARYIMAGKASPPPAPAPVPTPAPGPAQ